MRRLERNFKQTDLARATRIREKFIDAPVSNEESFTWSWPRRMQEVGEWRAGEGAVMYASNKWQQNPDHVIDYKHVAEGTQRLFVVPGFLRDYHRPGTQLDVVGPLVELNGPMPRAFAVLAPILGIQARLHTASGAYDTYQVEIANAILGAAVHPETERPFLFVYTAKDGPLCVLTGDILDVEKDGIVG